MLNNPTKPNILVVNDAPDMLELIRVLLISENYRVLTAINGREALDIALAHPLDCVVSDVVMPIMDGIELCSLLKNNPLTKHTPVLLASAMRTKDQDSLFGLNAGADDYLELPFRQTALLVKVARLVERSRLEKVLRDSERRYRTLYQDSPLMYFVLDKDGIMVSVNQNGIDRLGYSEEELIGKPVFDIFLEEDRPKVIAQIEKLRQLPGETEHFEARKVSKNGAIVFVSENIRLLPQDDDDESIFLIICEDITERKQTHDALRKSETRYQSVIENASVVFFTLDKNGIFTLSEGAGLKKLNLNPGEVLGQSVFDVYRDYESIKRDSQRALSGESFTAVADLGDLIFETSYTPFYDSNGELSGTVGVATDITERVVAERKAASVIIQLGATLEREALISRISNAIRESLRIEDVFSAVVNELGKHLELDRCHLYLFDEIAGLVRSMAQFAAPNVPLVSDEEIPFAIANRILPAFREEGYVAISDATNNAEIKELYEQILASRGVRSIMFVAIRVREGITGLLTLVTTNHNRNWSQADIALACAVADKAAIAIRQAELYQQAQATSQRETLINRLGTAIRSSLQLSEVLHAATHELGEALSASRSYIRFFDPQQLNSAAEYIYTAPEVESPLPPTVNFTMPIGNFILQNHATVVFNDVQTLPSEYEEMSEYAATVLARRCVRSAIYCPILINDNFRGAICIEQTDRLRRWTESDITLIEAVASQLTLGIMHAELFELTRRAKREWEATFDAMSDGVFNFDRNGILQRVNNAGAAMERAMPRSLIGKYCCEILAVEDEQVDHCIVQQVIKTRNRVTVERLSKQLKRPLLVTAEPLLDEGGELTGVVVTGRDLYELREAESVARERQSLLSHIVEGILEPIFAVNENGEILWCNGATREIYDVETAEISHRQFTEMIHPEDRKLADTALRASLKKLPQCYESRYLTRKNETRYAIFNSIPLVEDNEVKGVLWFVRDITGQKLALQQALQADKLRALGQLASGVAHNFNNSLAAILGRVSLLQRHTNDENISQNLNVIQTAAEDAAATVRRIQTFARQSATPDFSPIELGSLLQDSIELTRTRWQDEAKTRGISYSVTLSSNNVFYTYGNASELREVFVNLIVNALDAMPLGGRLEICPRQIESSIVLEFADDGEGIAEDVRERVFEPFFSTKGVNGTGLGLSVSYSIIKQHGGNIAVEPKLGGGSNFTVTLPVHDSYQTQKLAVMSPQPKRTLSILVVDDEDYVREALIEMISELATTVVGAESGQQALSKLQAQRFDVVFTDLSMPEMDGWDLAQTIRQNWGATKTVMVTGYGQGLPLVPEKRELVHAIIGKPFSFAQLSQTLEKISTYNDDSEESKGDAG
ncbi:MAG: PAS domain S-box protein [Pyrinomonadaceae bacterium]